MYQLLRDFAAPVATIIAAATAAYFVRRQALIAETQANTAIDQLRYNLFEKRFAIYEDVKNLIRLLVNDSHKDGFHAIDVVPHYVVMNEARFFFSDEICSWLKVVETDCQSFLMAHAAHEIKLEHTKRLVDHLTGMPERFKSELGFAQLTRRSGPKRNARWW